MLCYGLKKFANAGSRVCSSPGVTGEARSVGSVTVRVKDEKGKIYLGRGLSTDILEASARAYLEAHNKMAADSSDGSNGEGFGVR